MARVPEVMRRNPISQVASQPPQAGQGFAAIAQLAKIGEDFVRPKALEQAREAGEEAVYRDDNGVLQVDERSVLGGEMADAHNAAAYAKYLAGKQIDVSETMTELATKYEFDPAGFQEAANSYIQIQEQDESVPRALKEGLLAGIREEALRRFNGLQNSEIDRTRSDANRNTTAARNMLVDDYVNLFVGGNLQEAEAKLAEIQAITDFRVEAGYIQETEVEAEAFLRGVRGSAVAAGLARNLENLAGESSITEEYRAEILDSLNDPAIDPAVRARLYTATQGVLKGIDAQAIVAGLTDTSFMAQFNRVNTPPGGAYVPGLDSVNYSRIGIRNLPLSDTYRSQLSAVVRALGPEYGVQINSAAQPANGPNRTGSRRHDVDESGSGNTADFALTRNGEVITPTSDPAIYERLFELGGGVFSGIGLYEGFVHMGGGTAAAWGPDKTGASLPANFAAAIQRGRDNPLDLSGEVGPSGLPIGTDLAALRRQNAAGFEAAATPRIPITPVSEFLGMQFGLEIAVPILSRSPDTPMSDVLSEEQMAANPMFEDMNVSEVMNWANRQMTMKASDMAAQQVAIDQIEDPEVRAMASAALADRVQTQTRAENQAAAAYIERLNANDDTLTVQEVVQDQTLSDDAQRQIVAKLNKKREAQIVVQQTAMDLSDPNSTWNAYDSSQRNRVDDFFVAAIEGAQPLSDPNATALAFQIAERTGFIPKAMFNALRAASNSGDPTQLAAAMEFAGQVLDVQPNALGPYGGKTDVTRALSDYRFYAGFGSPEEAAARVIEIQQADPPKNVREAAKDAADNLSLNDIVSHYDDSMWSDPSTGSPVEQAAMMSDYTRLFTDEYMRTGDEDIAKNRALDQIGRVYGPNSITGSQRIMKFPPQNFYPAVNGSQDWMQTQIEAEVSQIVFGKDARLPTFMEFADITGDKMWVSASQIKLVSDDQTHSEVTSGRPPSYQVFYIDNDGMMQALGQRYQFDQSLAEKTDQAQAFRDAQQAEVDRRARENAGIDLEADRARRGIVMPLSAAGKNTLPPMP